MSKLFQNKPQNKQVELTIGTVYVKPLPMELFAHATKLADKDVNPVEQEVSFALILQETLVDAEGNPYEDLKDMTPDQVGSSFSLEDFTSLLQAIMPAAPEEGNGL